MSRRKTPSTTPFQPAAGYHKATNHPMQAHLPGNERLIDIANRKHTLAAAIGGAGPRSA
jgi:hypothetical protein